METNMTVANEIRNQVGKVALFMMGTKSLLASDNSLTLHIGKNPKSVTKIKITLDPSDTYTVAFLRIRNLECKTLASFSDVYADNLHSIISANTGLYLSL